jgi:hypothetical protein
MTTTLNLNATALTPDLVKGVKDKLDDVRQMFPFAVGLSARDRLTNRALGSRSTQFVQQSIENMKQNPSLVPAFVDVEEAETFYSMYNSLLGIRDSVEQLHRLVGDAMHMAGTMANKQSLDFYNSVKRGSKANVPGAQSVLENLKPRVKNMGRPKSNTTETNNGGTAPA